MLENFTSSPCKSSIKTFSTDYSYPSDVAQQIANNFEGDHWAFILIYFSPGRDPTELVHQLNDKVNNIPIFGCSTAGEITEKGMEEDCILCLGFPKTSFYVQSCSFENLQNFSIRLGQKKVRQQVSDFKINQPQHMQNNFALLIIDGLSYREEQMVSAIVNALDDIPLIGGSAGDGLNFNNTHIIANQQALTDSATLLLIHSRPSIHIFKSDNFCPTSLKFVVTKADPENRIVLELNAAPAAQTYAEAIGMRIDDLDMMSFATHPLSVRVGNDYYARSIQDMLGDGSFRFYCAIDEGIVFTLTQVEDMRAPLLNVFDEIENKIGTPAIDIGV